ncbi:MAG TPA: ATP-dependent DNA helicase [Acidimicrobiales bacterium]|nr:ATP-dependent DNA helicase [Acidimicrobiales bacterium]
MRSFDPDEEVAGAHDDLPTRDLHDDRDAADHDAVRAALDVVTASLPCAERREGQHAMAAGVADAIATHRHLVVEAGTGIGKSLGYLVPVALSKQRTVVATATKALQDQLIGKEVPSLAASGLSVTAAVLKGRQNYLCRQRLADVGAPQAALAFDDQETKGVATQLRRIAVWATSTETGERDHLGFEADPRAWARVSMPAEECPGADRCPFGSTCFAEQAKRRAEAADVIIVNAALYGAHLSTGRTLLPAHDVVVFDEAHELDAQLSRSLGVELSASRLRAIATLARHSGAHDATSIADELSRAGDRLAQVLQDRLARGATTGLDDTTRAVLDQAAAGAERLVEAVEALPASPGAEVRRWSTRGAAVHLRGDLVRLRDPGGDDLVFLDGNERQVTLVRAPVDVGPLLRDLWAESTGVLCSATMPLGLEDRLGLDPQRRSRLELASPFDYANHSLLYVPTHLPDRRDPTCEAEMADELAALVDAAGGRTLALFTSRRALAQVGAAVRDAVSTPVLLQGDSSRAALLRQFSSDESTSLFATMGFWQGVDVPGRTLSLVAIDRLPFGRPDDPMLQARRERAGDAAFSTVDVPRASMLLAQGVGRLIRTAEDRGVVCVLDTRLATASYRGALLRRLPPMRRTTRRDDAVGFLRAATALG